MRDVVTLLLALALAVAACVSWGCGDVTAAADGGASEVGGEADVGRDVEQQDTPPWPDVAASSSDSMLSTDAAADVGPSCSWECRAFCDCGPLPCCRSAGAADCCSR